MKQKLLSSGQYGCVYFPGVFCDKKVDTQYISKLSYYDKYSKNEASIGKKISKIENFKEHFIPIEKKCPLDNPDIFKKPCPLLKKKKKYMVLQSRYVPYTSFNNVIRNSNKIEKIISFLKDITYKLYLLEQNSIIHNDLHFANIMYDTKKENLYFIDFGLSLDLKKCLSVDYLKTFIFGYIPNYPWYPIEYYLLSYVISHEHIKDKTIQWIIENYLKEHVVFSKYNTYRYEYYKKSVREFKSLVKMNKKEQILFLSSYISSWDSYRVGLLFIYYNHLSGLDYPDLNDLLFKMIDPQLKYRLCSKKLVNQVNDFFIELKTKNLDIKSVTLTKKNNLLTQSINV